MSWEIFCIAFNSRHTSEFLVWSPHIHFWWNVSKTWPTWILQNFHFIGMLIISHVGSILVHLSEECTKSVNPKKIVAVTCKWLVPNLSSYFLQIGEGWCFWVAVGTIPLWMLRFTKDSKSFKRDDQDSWWRQKKLGGEGKKSETLEFLQKMIIIIHCYHQTISQTLTFLSFRSSRKNWFILQ